MIVEPGIITIVIVTITTSIIGQSHSPSLQDKHRSWRVGQGRAIPASGFVFGGIFHFCGKGKSSVHTHLITLVLFHICSFGGIMKLPILGVSAQLQCRRRICECNADLAEAWIRLQQPKSARYGVLLLKPTSLGLICFTEETGGFSRGTCSSMGLSS